MYTIGSPIVHPCHGAGIIKAITTKRIGQIERRYYVLDVLGATGEMRIFVPVKHADDLGIRVPGLASRLRTLICRCRQRTLQTEATKDYRKRVALTEGQLKSGSFTEVVEMVRCLATAALKRPLGIIDRQHLLAGKDMLATELALASGQTLEEAMQEIDVHLGALKRETAEDA